MLSGKILVVDDSRTIRRQVTFILNQAGYQTIEAEDGVTAITKLETNPEINMVISDVNMPNMNGLEMVERIRSTRRYDSLPVIILTCENNSTLIRQAKAAKVEYWLNKPFTPDKLIYIAKALVKVPS